MDPESAIVGIAIYEPEHIDQIRDRLPSPGYLHNSTNRELLRTAYYLSDNGGEVSPVTVAEELEGDALAEIGGASSIAKRANSYSWMDADRLQSCLDTVVNRHLKREARMELIQSREEIEDGGRPIEIIQRLQTKLDRLTSQTIQAEIEPLSRPSGELIDMLEEASKSGKLPGTLSTGFYELDDRMKGISPTDLILISADTGIGKTSLALQIADSVAAGQDGNVVIFSGEMEGWQIIMKILSKRGIATLDEMQDGEISDGQWKEIVDSQTSFRDLGLWIVQAMNPTIYDFKSAVRKADQDHGVDLAVLDYVQMLRNPSVEDMSEVEHLNLVSSELRDFTSDVEIPVLAITRENKRGSTYGSSQLKYDCNYRIVIWDPEDEDRPDKRLISVEKARLARGGAVPFIFEGEHSRFVPMSSAGGGGGGRQEDGSQSKRRPY